ncbi:hypothetical protein [Actinophytocola sp.]|uniref:hypothetical protein n=1 Tax=Actinophytocola sp. TaxID=1872138 RepID=UPI002EDA7F51
MRIAIIALWLALVAPPVADAQVSTLDIDGASPGLVFDGIGATVGGGTSRLLYDYPEPQRGEVLDYLFKPRFGAGLTSVKIDMGSDANQGTGSEPSSRHERDDENYDRGVQLWMAREARKRNPDITISALQAAPGWVGDYFSQDNIDYIVRWLKGVREHWGLTVDYFGGVVNEPSVIHQKVDWAWVNRLDAAINANGLRTKLVLGDDPVRGCCPTNLPWLAGEAMRADPELRQRVDVIGSHYGGGYVPDYVRDFGIPVWSLEDGPWTDAWNEFRGGGYNALGATYNLNYVTGHVTATQVWNAVSSYYDNQILPNSGLLRAAEPWSGHYEVTSPVWVTAHTTQFAKPGWRYLDGASRLLPGGGSVVTLKDGSDYSSVFETLRTADGAVPTRAQTVRVRVSGGLKADGVVHVWKSTRDSWFTRQADLPVVDGSYEITLEPDAMYSVTTTTGQRHGTTRPPAAEPFPASYRDDFESGEPSRQPKYLAQQGGSFELVPCVGRPGRCVEQAVAHQPIEWLRSDPTSFLGGSWSDVTVSARVRHLQPGYAQVWARIGNAGADNPDLAIPILPDGYYLDVEQTGRWELGYTVHGERHRLTAGHARTSANQWHTIEIDARGNTLRASIDGVEVGTATDDTYARGRAGIGTGWSRVQFDDLAVAP